MPKSIKLEDALKKGARGIDGAELSEADIVNSMLVVAEKQAADYKEMQQHHQESMMALIQGQANAIKAAMEKQKAISDLVSGHAAMAKKMDAAIEAGKNTREELARLTAAIKANVDSALTLKAVDSALTLNTNAVIKSINARAEKTDNAVLTLGTKIESYLVGNIKPLSVAISSIMDNVANIMKDMKEMMKRKNEKREYEFVMERDEMNRLKGIKATKH